MNDFNKKQLELNSLIEFSQLINTKLDLEFIFGNILLSVMGKMMIMKGAILLKSDSLSDKGHIFTIKAVKGISQNAINQRINLVLPPEPGAGVAGPGQFLHGSDRSFYTLCPQLGITFLNFSLGIASLVFSN